MIEKSMIINCRLVRFVIFNIVYSVSELWTVLVVGLVPLVFVFAIWNLSKCANRVSCNAALQAATIRINMAVCATLLIVVYQRVLRIVVWNFLIIFAATII